MMRIRNLLNDEKIDNLSQLENDYSRPIKSQQRSEEDSPENKKIKLRFIVYGEETVFWEWKITWKIFTELTQSAEALFDYLVTQETSLELKKDNKVVISVRRERLPAFLHWKEELEVEKERILKKTMPLRDQEKRPYVKIYGLVLTKKEFEV